MSEQEANTGDPVLQWVTFKLADETYGINVMQVQEILRMTEIAPVPGAASYVVGIINLRGNVVTVVDTRLRFSLPPYQETDDTRIIILEIGQSIVGMLVDKVSEVVYLNESEIDTAPHLTNEDSSRFIQGVVSNDKDLLILLDTNKLLSQEEPADPALF